MMRQSLFVRASATWRRTGTPRALLWNSSPRTPTPASNPSGFSARASALSVSVWPRCLSLSHSAEPRDRSFPLGERDERPRIRSLFSVPGADERKIRKARTLGADAVVLDLEDGVAHDRKDEARELVTDTLLDESLSFGDSQLCVRVNGLRTEHAIRDLEAVLPCPRLRSIVLPKVESGGDISFVARMIEEHRPQAAGAGNEDVRILAAIESARGFLNLREIAETAVSERRGRLVSLLEGLVFASEDYCADVGAIRTKAATELLYARSRLVLTAKAHGLQAIDMVHINFRDLDDLASECEAGRQLGFTGKQAIHPSQVAIIHEQFSPSRGDVAFAARVAAAFEANEAAGRGACVVDGIVVDLPVYKWAVKICKEAEREAQR